MNFIRIAARVANSLSDRPDYGESDAALPRGAEETNVSVVEKTPDKNEWCVKSEKNPDWSGGCYESKGKAENRLNQVEMFKHMKAK